jgi:hypothetical protein
VQIAIIGEIFILTLTQAGPAFPILIVLLVPFRLMVMNRIWNRETLRHVDAWACKDGTPEDDEDMKKGLQTVSEPSVGVSDDVELGELPSATVASQRLPSRASAKS